MRQIFKATPSGFYLPDEMSEAVKGPLPCAIGKNGLILDKREGDQASPIGIWDILKIFYRADKIEKPICHFPLSAIKEEDGWCDAPDHPNYNQLITLPFTASHENLWREDDIYDIVVVLKHNIDPTTPYHGSAIFMHIARPDYSGTAGCVALKREDLEMVLKFAKLGDAIEFCEYEKC